MVQLNNITSFILCVYILASLTVVTYGAKKQWLRNTNYDNPDNWDAGRLPCPLDTIQFPDPSPAVYLTASITASQLILPSNGQFMLSDGFSLSAVAKARDTQASTSQGSVKGQGANESLACNSTVPIRFNRTEPEDWFNPLNWCELSTDGSCTDPQPERLNSEQVPCENDDVIFPRGNSFLVQIASPTAVKMKSFKIGQNTFDEEQLHRWMNSNIGKAQFKLINETDLKVLNKKCSDKTGCSCGNDKGEVLRKICELQTPHCGKNMCAEPVLPKGHCCSLCGAVMFADYGFNFQMKKLQNRLKSKFLTEHIQIIISKSSNDRIQIVVSDFPQDGEEAKRKANEMYTFIQKDIRTKKALGLINIQLQLSGKGVNVRPQPQKGNKHMASIAGIVVTVIVVLLLIALTMYCLVDKRQFRRWRDKIPSSITFRRFSTEDGQPGESVEMGDTVSYIDIMNRMEQQTTFDNPMYGTHESVQEKDQQDVNNSKVVNNNDQPAVLDASSVTYSKGQPRVKRGNSFSNPLFGEKLTDSDYLDANIKMNPVFNADDIEDSNI